MIINRIPYFPNPFSLQDIYDITQKKPEKITISDLGFNDNYEFVNSGRNGLRLLLKSFDLKKGEKVGMPSLICNSVPWAVTKENLTPYFFDINKDYQINFNKDIFFNSGIKVLILPHYYGSIHPQTKEIINWCKNNRVYLIQDLAQSFSLKMNGKPLIETGDGGIYSFGPGKASTAAGGSIVYGIDKNRFSVREPTKSINKMLNLYAINLLKLRTVGYQIKNRKILNLINKFLNYYNDILFDIKGISNIQLQAIKKIIENYDSINVKRKKNWYYIHENINNNYFKVPPPYLNSLGYKYVFFLDDIKEENVNAFYFEMNKYFSIRRVNNIKVKYFKNFYYNLSCYKKIGNNLFEVSSEATLPMDYFEKMIQKFNEFTNVFFNK